MNSPVASWNLSSDPLTRQRRVTWGPLETTFAYDSRGRVTKVSESPGGETLMSVKLEYNGDQIWVRFAVDVNDDDRLINCVIVAAEFHAVPLGQQIRFQI